MAGKETLKTACKTVRTVMSTDCWEARRRVLGLYRACYRYIPYIIKYFDIPKCEEDCRMKLRELFYTNAFVTDVRVIDILVIKKLRTKFNFFFTKYPLTFVLKGYMELKEITHQWQQKGHVMANWNPTLEPKPNNFICKFLSGLE